MKFEARILGHGIIREAAKLNGMNAHAFRGQDILFQVFAVFGAEDAAQEDQRRLQAALFSGQTDARNAVEKMDQLGFATQASMKDGIQGVAGDGDRFQAAERIDLVFAEGFRGIGNDVTLGVASQQGLHNLFPLRNDCCFAMAIEIDVRDPMVQEPVSYAFGLILRERQPLIVRLRDGAINTSQIALAGDFEVGVIASESLSEAWGCGGEVDRGQVIGYP